MVECRREIARVFARQKLAGGVMRPVNKRLTKSRPQLLTRAAFCFLLPLVLLFCAGTAGAAISRNQLTTGSNTSAANSYTTASITPGANRLILAWVAAQENTGPVAPTLSGNGLTWVRIGSAVGFCTIGGPNRNITLFRAMGSAPTAGSVTINFSKTHNGAIWQIQEYSGVDTSGTNGSGAIVQSATNVADGYSGSSYFNVTLGPITSGNATAAGFSTDSNVPSLTVGTGYTNFVETGTAGPALSLNTEWKAAGSTPVPIYLLGNSDIAGIAVEIQAGYNVSGRIFEDGTFAGTAANWDGGVSDLGLANVTVELYSNANVFLASTTTAAGGTYSFSGCGNGSYKVRAVSTTIGDANTPPQGGFNACVPGTCAYPIPTMTWGNAAASYGGQSPTADDTTTGAGAGPGNSYTAVTVSGANFSNVNLGFAYNLIVSADDDNNIATTRSKAGTLRQFIKNANAIGSAGSTSANSSQFRMQVATNQSSGGDTWWRIAPASVLPSLSDNGTTIDGSTQRINSGLDSNSRGPEIEVNGAGFPIGNGIHINNVGGVMVKELAINSFDSAGIYVSGAGATNSRFFGNYIGTDAVGDTASANSSGINLDSGTSNTDIGGINPGEGNLLSGNTNFGINIFSSNGNRVRGNKIGTNSTGAVKVANSDGITISGTSASNTIGGSTAVAGNFISGNTNSGIHVTGTVTNLSIFGNTIGTGPAGSENLGNGFIGVDIGAPNIIVGGVNNGEGNVIANSGFAGVYATKAGIQVKWNNIRNNTRGIFGDLGCDGMVIANNLIWQNSNFGIYLSSNVTSFKVYQNTLNGNTGDGIKLNGTGAIIKNNLITGNSSYGINRVAASMTEAYNDVTDASTIPANGSGRSNVSLDSTDLNANPLYTNAAAGVFTLQNTSPAINRGLDLGVDQPDMNGAIGGNFNGYAPDMGALESGVTNTCPVSSTADSGAGTLRACITYANTNPGTMISFSISSADSGYQTSVSDHWWRIAPVSVLPTITAAGTIIDGTTQTTNSGDTNSKGPEIEINNANALANVHGLNLSSANNAIKGLAINGFSSLSYAGINITGASATGNTVKGCYLGTNALGTSSTTGYVGTLGNYYGLAIQSGAQSNVIGGTLSAAADRNVISNNTNAGNQGYGVYMAGAGTNNNVVKGNYIGPDSSGSSSIANSNWFSGVEITTNASNNTIGSSTTGEGNVISGNYVQGVTIDGGATGNIVKGNYIGIKADGTGALKNGGRGVWINSTAGNTIGGTGANDRNIISGNNSIGGIVISNAGADNNQVYGNYIGTNPAGTAALPNSDGVVIGSGAKNNIVGGSAAGQANVIAYNSGAGVFLVSAGTTGNMISGNSIYSNTELGIDIAGAASVRGVGTGSGANNNKARPTITAITANGANFDITVTVTSGDTIEFFRVNNAAAPAVTADGTGSGEGYLYLGKCVDNGPCSGPYISGAADANGTAGTVKITLTAGGMSSIDYVTATATDAVNGTSEFAANITIDLCPGNVVTTTADTGMSSLRECINKANTTAGTTIRFNISSADSGYQTSGPDHWWRITPVTVLPTITAAGTIIDGTTQTTNQGNANTKGPEVELFGNGASFNGININASTTTVKGLTINSFTGNRGIDIIGGGTNTITNCYIGTNYAGTAAMANACGIFISGGTGGNNIGAAGAGNVISGNSMFGIVVGTPSTANVIKGNYVGTNASGTAAIANGMRGVEVNNGCSNTTIGGAAAGEGNIISGNTWVGVAVFNSSNTNIYGNTIGTGVTGAENLGNGIYGVEIDTGSSSTNIGGLGSGQGNVIANTGTYHGVIIQPGAGANNVISGNTVRNSAIEGIAIFRAGVVIQKNLVRNNSSNGIFIDAGASNNVLVYHNTLHGNGIHGIHNLSTSTGLVLRNNIITGNGSYGVNVVAGGSITESYNDVTDAATAPANASGRSNAALDATDLNVNPLYINAAGGNFSLTECTSPVINQGIDLAANQPDMNGAAAGLWNNNAPDLGAFETSSACAPTLAIVKQAWDLSGSAPLTSLTAPVGSTIAFLIYVKNTTAGPVTDLRINDSLDETAFQYVTGSLLRTSAGSSPADSATDLVIFTATASGTGTVMSDGVDGDAASALNTGGLPDIDRITIGAVAGQANASLSLNGHSTFGLRFKVKIK